MLLCHLKKLSRLLPVSLNTYDAFMSSKKSFAVIVFVVSVCYDFVTLNGLCMGIQNGASQEMTTKRGF